MSSNRVIFQVFPCVISCMLILASEIDPINRSVWLAVRGCQVAHSLGRVHGDTSGRCGLTMIAADLPRPQLLSVCACMCVFYCVIARSVFHWLMRTLKRGVCVL